jgi:hypothetical protein
LDGQAEVDLAAKGRHPEEPDDGQRGATGVAISIVERPDGSARLVLDDVRRTGSGAPYRWASEFFFTRIEFDAADLIDCRLGDDDLKNIGFAVVAMYWFSVNETAGCRDNGETVVIGARLSALRHEQLHA